MMPSRGRERHRFAVMIGEKQVLLDPTTCCLLIAPLLQCIEKVLCESRTRLLTMVSPIIQSAMVVKQRRHRRTLVFACANL